MAFWHRIGKSKLKTACTQFRRCYIHPPHASSLNSNPKPLPMEIPHPYSFFHGRPTRVCNSVRSFAAPVQFQAKYKKEEDDFDGPRLNDQIKAPYVRLVVDDGHSIVSRFQALERAKNLKLDLVEVQKNGKPPVCKIMDFHKEMYKRQEKEKERAKSKADVTLRRDCKEVRFSEKTELKDLKMKADMVTKLMEKGYRVKCRATSNENPDVTGSISRLLVLIEDVCVVESGPLLARKEAYMIVRHVKYGPAKKGGKKLQDAAHTAAKAEAEEDNMEPLSATSSDSIEYENQSSAEYGFETGEEVLSNGEEHLPFSAVRSDKSISDKNDSASPAGLENRYKKADHPGENKVRSNTQVPPAVTENRYKRVEQRNRFQQTPSNTGPGIRDADRWRRPLDPNQTRRVPVDSNFNPRIENTRQATNVTPGSRNSIPSREDISKHPRAPNAARPGYGVFSSTNGPKTQGVTTGMHRNR